MKAGVHVVRGLDPGLLSHFPSLHTPSRLSTESRLLIGRLNNSGRYVKKAPLPSPLGILRAMSNPITGRVMDLADTSDLCTLCVRQDRPGLVPVPLS